MDNQPEQSVELDRLPSDLADAIAIIEGLRRKCSGLAADRASQQRQVDILSQELSTARQRAVTAETSVASLTRQLDAVLGSPPQDTADAGQQALADDLSHISTGSLDNSTAASSTGGAPSVLELASQVQALRAETGALGQQLAAALETTVQAQAEAQAERDRASHAEYKCAVCMTELSKAVFRLHAAEGDLETMEQEVARMQGLVLELQATAAAAVSSLEQTEVPQPVSAQDGPAGDPEPVLSGAAASLPPVAAPGQAQPASHAAQAPPTVSTSTARTAAVPATPDMVSTAQRLARELQRATNEVSSLQAQVTALSGQLAASQADLAATRDKLQQLEQRQTGTVDASAAQQTVTSLQAQVEALASELQDALSAKATLGRQRQEGLEQRERLQQELATVQGKLDEQTAAVTRLTKDLEDANTANQAHSQRADRLATHKADFLAQVQSLTSRLEQQQRLHEDQLRSMEQQHAEALAVLQSEHASALEGKQLHELQLQLQASQERHEAQLQAVREAHTTDVCTALETHEDRMSQLMVEHGEAVDELQAQHAAQMAALQHQHEAEVTALENENARALVMERSLRQGAQEALNGADGLVSSLKSDVTRLTAELSSLSIRHQQELAGVTTRHAEELAGRAEQYNAELSTLRDTLSAEGRLRSVTADRLTSTERELSLLQQDHTALLLQHAALSQQHGAAQDELNSAHQQLCEAQEQLSASEQRRESLVAALQHHQAEGHVISPGASTRPSRASSITVGITDPVSQPVLVEQLQAAHQREALLVAQLAAAKAASARELEEQMELVRSEADAETFRASELENKLDKIRRQLTARAEEAERRAEVSERVASMAQATVTELQQALSTSREALAVLSSLVKRFGEASVVQPSVTPATAIGRSSPPPRYDGTPQARSLVTTAVASGHVDKELQAIAIPAKVSSSPPAAHSDGNSAVGQPGPTASTRSQRTAVLVAAALTPPGTSKLAHTPSPQKHENSTVSDHAHPSSHSAEKRPVSPTTAYLQRLVSAQRDALSHARHERDILVKRMEAVTSAVADAGTQAYERSFKAALRREHSPEMPSRRPAPQRSVVRSAGVGRPLDRTYQRGDGRLAETGTLTSPLAAKSVRSTNPASSARQLPRDERVPVSHGTTLAGRRPAPVPDGVRPVLAEWYRRAREGSLESDSTV